jgi:fibronectin-binding autotransporter adhesin
VGAGTVALDGGPALDDANPVTVELGAILRLIDSERIGAVTNRGTLDLSAHNGTADMVLTVNGDFAGGSVLRIDAMLGDDSSISDRVVISCATSGTTSVFVNVLGGTGAPISAGILVVDVGGASDGSFVLSTSNVMLPGNELGIAAGSYVYALRNMAGDWFLQSQLQGFTDALEALPSALPGLTRPASLIQRLAGRRILTAPPTDAIELTASSRGMQARSAASGAWLTVRASDIDVTPETSSSGLTYDQSTWRVQAGFDTVLSEASAGSWVIGAGILNGSSDLHATSPLGDGVVATDATGAGLTATWYANSSFYPDVQMEFSRFKSDVGSSSAAQLANGVKGSGRFASAEMGRALAMQNELLLTPQAQLSWAEVSLDSFTGSDGSFVSVGDSDSLQLRLGLAAERSWTDGFGSESRIYGIANIRRKFAGATSVLLGDSALGASSSDLTAELGVGGSIDWQHDRGKTLLFGDVNAVQGIGGDDLSGVSGTTGLRLTW